ncbi:MAG: hypothetical protein ETSY1_16300 [Candidatus Entotheonella factor]|uniref:Uncharacterized protein n=1 Tax=Entotheonella factor TaxID=1429438 RepID=W4LM86_ENTF1|nr:MAG: hypothetical protein ETSY1_16300 [Candidatus Entotheonella factor]
MDLQNHLGGIDLSNGIRNHYLSSRQATARRRELAQQSRS